MSFAKRNCVLQFHQLSIQRSRKTAFAILQVTARLLFLTKAWAGV